ncbi:MAG TPA: TMEM43 family protein [Chthoniobacterales bacterium]|nr:TMEM43 family protein [Chthoniobacterales bacterium]
MANVITEVTNQSIFGRIGNSFLGMLFGLALLIGSVVLLFWNEGRAVSTAKSLTEGSATVIDVPSDSVTTANDSRLVHVTGDTAVAGPLEDPLFNISESVVRLRRNVEVYEWKEKKESKSRDKIGGGKETVTTYSYEKVWAPELIRSSSFKDSEEHKNPAKLEIPKKEFVSKNTTLGGFKLTPAIVEKIPGDEVLEVSEAQLSKVSDDLKDKLKMDGDHFYLGEDPGNPAIGDEKVSFTVLRPGTVSIVARQTRQTFEPYLTTNGREIELVESGSVSAPLMFAHAQAANRTLTWILRGVGFAAMFIAILLVLGPITALARILPFLGSLVEVGFAAVAFFVSAIVSLLVVGTAWVVYRPLLGFLLILAAIACIVMLKRLHSKRTPVVSPA